MCRCTCTYPLDYTLDDDSLHGWELFKYRLVSDAMGEMRRYPDWAGLSDEELRGKVYLFYGLPLMFFLAILAITLLGWFILAPSLVHPRVAPIPSTLARRLALEFVTQRLVELSD